MICRFFLMSSFFILLSSYSYAVDINTATKYYYQGDKFLKAKQYSKAYKAFQKAYSNTPLHKEFYCHRARFSEYMGKILGLMKRPYQAMRKYYQAAYQSRCKDKSITRSAGSSYRRMYNRWMSSIQIITIPHKARVVEITPKGDVEWGVTEKDTGFKKTMMPSKFKLKVRLYDHKTIFFTFDLKAGNHIKKELKLEKGTDPIYWKEKGGISLDFLANVSKKEKKDEDKELKEKEKENTDNPNKIVGDAKDLKNLKLPGEEPKNLPKGPPVYKKAWFWAVIGTVVVGGTLTAILVPKPKKILLNQGSVF